MQPQKASPYAPLITAATEAPATRLGILEEIMRTEVFHSTLDWQSAEVFAEGAREAQALYQSAPAYYETLKCYQQKRFQVEKLEKRLERARKKASPEKLAELETIVALARGFENRLRESVPRLADFYGLC